MDPVAYGLFLTRITALGQLPLFNNQYRGNGSSLQHPSAACHTPHPARLSGAQSNPTND
jgi:hypothetical protein